MEVSWPMAFCAGSRPLAARADHGRSATVNQRSARSSLSSYRFCLFSLILVGPVTAPTAANPRGASHPRLLSDHASSAALIRLPYGFLAVCLFSYWSTHRAVPIRRTPRPTPRPTYIRTWISWSTHFFHYVSHGPYSSTPSISPPAEEGTAEHGPAEQLGA